MSRIIYRTRKSTYRSLTPGACMTRGWQTELEWSPRIQKLYAQGGPHRAALDGLIRHHAAALPATMRAGQDVSTALEDEGEQLFSDTVFLMTSCGSHPEWESPRKSRCRIFSLIAYPSSF